MRTFLKYYSIPAVLFVAAISFCGYMAWSENQLKNVILNEALQGNKQALALMVKYEKPWKLNDKVVRESLKGNQYALEILKIDSNGCGKIEG